MKKYLFQIKIVLIALLCVFILYDVGRDQTSSVGIESVTEEVLEAAKMKGAVPAEERMVKRFYGLNPKDYKGAVLFAPKDNMDVNEIFIVKLKDSSQAEEVEKAIRERLETQQKSFEGYGAGQTALLKAHTLDVRGNYVFYMVGENVTAAHKAFLNSL